MVVNGIDASGPVRAAALVGVVLAGGEGRRMGAGVPKPLRTLGGKTMVPLVAKALPALLADADWRRRHAALMMLSQVAEARATPPLHDTPLY